MDIKRCNGSLFATEINDNNVQTICTPREFFCYFGYIFGYGKGLGTGPGNPPSPSAGGGGKEQPLQAGQTSEAPDAHRRHRRSAGLPGYKKQLPRSVNLLGSC